MLESDEAWQWTLLDPLLKKAHRVFILLLRLHQEIIRDLISVNDKIECTMVKITIPPFVHFYNWRKSNNPLQATVTAESFPYHKWTPRATNEKQVRKCYFYMLHTRENTCCSNGSWLHYLVCSQLKIRFYKWGSQCCCRAFFRIRYNKGTCNFETAGEKKRF